MVAAVTSNTEQALGAILVGGASTRMGTDKAGVAFGESVMLEWVAAALREAGCEVVVVGREEPGFDLQGVPDDDESWSGPAAGLATALRLAAGRPVALVATDQPLIRSDTIRSLLDIEADAVVPVDEGVRQTTCAVYRAACEEPLHRMRAEGAPSLQRLLRVVEAREVGADEWESWGEDGRSWWSLDTPEDVAAAESFLRAER